MRNPLQVGPTEGDIRTKILKKTLTELDNLVYTNVSDKSCLKKFYKRSLLSSFVTSFRDR